MNQHFFPRRIPVFIVMVGLLSVTGCIKIDTTLTLNNEGGGTLRAMYGMPGFLVRQLEVTRQWTQQLDLASGKTNAAPPPSLDIPMIYDETVLKGRFKRMEADGITLDALRTKEQGGWNYVEFTLKFSRLDALMKQSMFRECGVQFKRQDDENCRLSISLPPTGFSASQGGVSAPDTIAKITPFLNGMRVIVRIDLPGDIRNSTATMSDSRRATWEWDFDKDARVVDSLSQDKMVVVFRGSKVRISDFEKRPGTTLLLGK